MAIYQPDNDYFVQNSTQTDADGIIKPAYSNNILRGGFGGGYLLPRFTIDTALNTYAANDLFALAIIPIESVVIARDSWIDHDDMGTTLTLDITTIDLDALTASTSLWGAGIDVAGGPMEFATFSGGSATRDVGAGIPNTVGFALLVAKIATFSVITNGANMQFYIKVQN